MAKNPDSESRFSPKALVQEYLEEHLPIYRELRELRRQASTNQILDLFSAAGPSPPSPPNTPFQTNKVGQGWQNPAGDTYFQNQRLRADQANAQTKTCFFKLMRNIGLELDGATSALTIPSNGNSHPAILDLCMAPGGFSSAALSRNPSAVLRGISLPPSQGGHEMLLHKDWSEKNSSARIYVSLRDITLLADEMGIPVSSIPTSHPEAASFSPDRPFLDQKFDLVFCDGQVLRTHERLEYREQFEASRLFTAQLVLGLQRVRSGGTMVILCHKADAWRSVHLMYTFAALADKVELFKPQKGHKTRSSFYIVAKGVRPECEAAVEAVRGWKAKWSLATFGLGGAGEDRLGEAELELLESGGEEKVTGVLREFGPTLVRMVEPVFAIQARALKEAPWMKKTAGGS